MLKPTMSASLNTGKRLTSLLSGSLKTVPTKSQMVGPVQHLLPPANLMSSFSTTPASLFTGPSSFPIQQARMASSVPSGGVNSGKGGSPVHFYSSPGGDVEISPAYEEAEQAEWAKTPAAKAAGFQGRDNYPGVDDWKNITIPAGFKVGRGYPGTGDFAFPSGLIDQTGHDAKNINQAIQVGSRDGKFRDQVEYSELTENTQVGFSKALANPHFGKGGSYQFYIPTHSTALKFNSRLPVGNTSESPSELVPYKKNDIVPYIQSNVGTKK